LNIDTIFMISNIKLQIFLLLLVFAFITSSCKKSKYDVIPDVYIDFYLDLNDPEFFNLGALGNSVLVNANTNNLGEPAAGYNGNGIIIYSGPDEFYAYDRTCPHDFVTSGLSIKVNVDGIYAQCPKCGTKYALPANGTPSSGPGRYPLKNYKTSFTGQYIHVWNYF
jgi:nitrite reductase/ring-hydroxylating ferredoxin subunit